MDNLENFASILRIIYKDISDKFIGAPNTEEQYSVINDAISECLHRLTYEGNLMATMLAFEAVCDNCNPNRMVFTPANSFTRKMMKKLEKTYLAWCIQSTVPLFDKFQFILLKNGEIGSIMGNDVHTYIRSGSWRWNPRKRCIEVTSSTQVENTTDWNEATENITQIYKHSLTSEIVNHHE